MFLLMTLATFAFFRCVSCLQYLVLLSYDRWSNQFIFDKQRTCSGFDQRLFLEKVRVGDCTSALHFSLEYLLSAHVFSPSFESPKLYCSKTIYFKVRIPNKNLSRIVRQDRNIWYCVKLFAWLKRNSGWRSTKTPSKIWCPISEIMLQLEYLNS